MNSRNVLPLFLLAFATGCASILGGGSSQSVILKPTPSNASFVVKSSSGLEMASGSGEQTVRLPRKNEYQVEIKAPGYQTKSVAISKGLNGWVWGNLIVGWIVGFGIDFISGAAYKLEPALISVSMEKASSEDFATAHILLYNAKGVLLKDIPTALVPLQQ